MDPILIGLGLGALAGRSLTRGLFPKKPRYNIRQLVDLVEKGRIPQKELVDELRRHSNVNLAGRIGAVVGGAAGLYGGVAAKVVRAQPQSPYSLEPGGMAQWTY